MFGSGPVRRGLAVVVRCVPVGSGWFRQAMLCLDSVCFGEAVKGRQVWSRRVQVRSGEAVQLGCVLLR